MKRANLLLYLVFLVLQTVSTFHFPYSYSSNRQLPLSERKQRSDPSSSFDVTEIEKILGPREALTPLRPNSTDRINFPDYQSAGGIDEKALRQSPFGKVLFGIIDKLFPVFGEPNWFDVYDPPLSAEENLALPYFDGYDFVNSTWTITLRHRYGFWNWLDRLGWVPQATQRVFLRQDGKTVWSDGYYGNWYINPALNYFQIEKHYGRGYGATQYHR
jgi:hypothetical protein